ncbi:hypothetical protein LTR37_019631 [Vermiconidia calcicola]|uniref:Uncharacterized protein n=1 Tax=Vermiconidia calcicola TaxID=1690605 RepID=A0ACC3MDH9_9PEZI|nr:hypothetical protein LTR37_019631 [Vermiconidia calcicola]
MSECGSCWFYADNEEGEKYYSGGWRDGALNDRRYEVADDRNALFAITTSQHLQGATITVGYPQPHGNEATSNLCEAPICFHSLADHSPPSPRNRMVTFYRHIALLPTSLLQDLAQAHRLMDIEETPAGLPKLNGEQVAIQPFCTIMVGVEEWEGLLDKVRMPDVIWDQNHDLRKDQKKERAMEIMEQVFEKVQEIDAELAKILEWVCLDGLGPWAAM